MSDPITRQQADFLVRHLGVDPGSLAGSGTPQAPALALADQRAFLAARVQKAQADLATETGHLCRSIGALVPFEDPEAIRTGVTAALRRLLAEVMVPVRDAIERAAKDGDADHAALRRAVAEGQARCRESGLLEALRNNALTAGQGFDQAVTGALDEIERTLTA